MGQIKLCEQEGSISKVGESPRMNSFKREGRSIVSNAMIHSSKTKIEIFWFLPVRSFVNLS